MAPRYKSAERQEAMSQTRQQLLQAAAAEFAQHGYAQANINTISQTAGFAKGTIYNYFPSKQALMLALLEETAAAHTAAVAEAVRDEEDPAQRLVRFFEAGFAFVAQHVAQSRTMITVIYGPDTELRQHLYRLYQPMFRLVAEEILGPGMTQGVFRDVDPTATATLLMTIYLGSASHVDDQGVAWLDPAQVARFTLRALRAPSERTCAANPHPKEEGHAT